GADNEKEGQENVFTIQVDRKQEHERVISRNIGNQRTDEKLYQSSHERENDERSHDSQSLESNPIANGQSHEQHTINIKQVMKKEQERKNDAKKSREFARNIDK